MSVYLQLAGLGLIIAGAVVQTRFRDYLDFFGSTFSAVAVVAIIIGCVIFVIGFFGCCGAYKEQYCMIMTVSISGFPLVGQFWGFQKKSLK